MRNFKIILSSLVLALPLTAFASGTLTGTVTNLTTNKPSVGDQVTIMRMDAGMQEAGTTTTDAHGHYSLALPDDGMHLVRVSHDKTSYFKNVQPGTTTADINIYNAAARVAGVATEADVFRIQTDASGSSLTIVESFFIKNDSAPPVTQFSNNPFDFWLPDGAIVEGSAALAPGSTMPVQAAPVPLTEKNHYTFLFPLRPGETRFQISYKVPYSGKLTITPHLSTTTGTLAYLLPKSITFTPNAGSTFTPVPDDASTQTFVARAVSPQQALGFTLSGTGQLPRETDTSGQPSASGGPQPAGADQSAALPAAGPGGGMSTPVDPEGTRDPWAKYKWWILGGLALLLAAAAGIMLRTPPTSQLPQPAATPVPPATPQSHQANLLQGIKEELFALETDRLQNRISEGDYLQQKAALETVLLRALNRDA